MIRNKAAARSIDRRTTWIRRLSGFFRVGSEQLGVLVVTLLLRRLDFLNRDAMGVGPGILPDPRHLPGNFHSRLVGLDHESVGMDLFRHNGLREAAHHSELVTEITVQGLEIIWKLDGGHAIPVGDRVSVVDVHHVRTFDEGVREGFVLRIEGVVDLERSSAFAYSAVDLEITGEEAITTGVDREDIGEVGT